MLLCLPASLCVKSPVLHYGNGHLLSELSCGQLRVQVSAGARHTIAMSQQAAFGWGHASEGQLGSDVSEPVLSPHRIRGLPRHPPLLYLVAAGDHSFAVAGECGQLSRQIGRFQFSQPTTDGALGPPPSPDSGSPTASAKIDGH